MYFGLHTTRKVERDAVRETDYELIDIDPRDFHRTTSHKPIVIEEDSGTMYEHDIKPFLDSLKMIAEGHRNFEDMPYFLRWKYKGEETRTRLRRLPELFESIKELGIQEPVACEQTGERIDGSFRTKIAIFLGIKSVKAKLYKFNWRDIDESFIERKIKAREASSGKDYYQFSYGYKDWENIKNAGRVYQENATDRWELIKPLIKGDRVIDIGCNEGYMACQIARMGKEVLGIDHDWWHIANLNRLVFEWVDKKDRNLTFKEQDITQAEVSGYDDALVLNVLYHIPREEQKKLLRKLRGTRCIFQCNLRKEAERDAYYTSHPDDLKELLKAEGYVIEEEISWRDKPIIIATYGADN